MSKKIKGWENYTTIEQFEKMEGDTILTAVKMILCTIFGGLAGYVLTVVIFSL